jgi:hypothetical protein
VATGAGSLTLLSQSPFVESGQGFHLGLAVTAPTPDTRLEVLVYPRLTTRTDFAATLKGKLRSPSDYMLGPHPVSSLGADPAGGIDITIPVNPTTDTGTVPPLITRSDSGVFPVQVRLLDHAGNTLGAPLTTFLVYASSAANSALQTPNGANGLPRLDVALTVPVHEPPSVARNGQPARLSPTESSSLAALAGVLGTRRTVPLTLDATPQTLDTLAAGSGTDRATLATLVALANGGSDQVAGTTYTSVTLPGLVGAGLGAEVTDQITTGVAALGAELRRAPPPGSWTVNGPLDQTTLESLTAAGVTHLVVPGTDLSAPPAAFAQTTLAAPAELATKSGPPVEVAAADPALSGHFTNGGDTILAANQLLAELAMIQLETPGETRGVVVMPPADWQASAPFLDVVLGGLSDNPLLAPVTTSTLFSAVPAASHASTPLVRNLTAARPNVAPFANAELIRSARAAVGALGSIYPGDRARVATLDRQVLTSEADDLTAAQRNRVAGTVTATLADLRHNITLPGASSITLTARDGGVPITVASNGPPGAQVQLRLSSDKLSFRPFSPAGGHCTAPATGVEVCTLALASQATTLKIPVVARTSGVFSLAATLSSPDGAVKIDTIRATVRSTAFSGVGVILIVVAALALAYWWVTNIRHGRRARDLIPVDVDAHQVMEQGVVDPGGATGSTDGPGSTGGPGSSAGPVPPPGAHGAGNGEQPSPEPAGADVAAGAVGAAGAARPDVAAGAAGAAGAVGAARAAGDDVAAEPDLAAGPVDAASPEEAAEGTLLWLDEDPVIADFFASPAPVYPPPAPDPPRRR